MNRYLHLTCKKKSVGHCYCSHAVHEIREFTSHCPPHVVLVDLSGVEIIRSVITPSHNKKLLTKIGIMFYLDL